MVSGTRSRPDWRPILEREVHATKNIPIFQAARLRHPALAAHESVASVGAVLGNASPERNAEKDVLIRALLSEFQKSRHPYWSGTLILAYLPMMKRLARACRDVLSADDGEQFVVRCFLEVIASLSFERNWLCLTIRRKTERRVFQHLRHQRRLDALLSPMAPDELVNHQGAACDPHDLWPPSRLASADRGLDPEEQDACAAFLAKHASGVLDPEELDLVTTTLVHGERLTSRVERCFPDLDDDDRDREYQRIKRRHSRAIGKLRRAMASLWEAFRREGEDSEWGLVAR